MSWLGLLLVEREGERYGNKCWELGDMEIDSAEFISLYYDRYYLYSYHVRISSVRRTIADTRIKINLNLKS